MSTLPAIFSRRALLGAALAAALPLPAFSQRGRDPANQEPTDMRVRMRFTDQTMTATLYDNPAARDFASMLPLDLEIENFGSNEKIAYLPRKLTEEAIGPFGNEQPGDLCYYVPWGNLAMFYAPYKHPGLIRLGRFDDYKPLLTRGTFPLRIDLIR